MSSRVVDRLEKVYQEPLGEALGALSVHTIEEAILNCPPGTMTALLRQIAAQHDWSSLYEAIQRHDVQWMIDLTEFFPPEEAFVEPLVDLLELAWTEHAKIVLALECAGWPWGPQTRHLLPRAHQAVLRILGELSDVSSVCRLNLAHVAEQLLAIQGHDG